MKSVKLPKCVGLGNGHSEEKSEANRGKQKQGVYVTRESAGNVVERAVVMTLRRAEVNEGDTIEIAVMCELWNGILERFNSSSKLL